jgi:hypothetical protein
MDRADGDGCVSINDDLLRGHRRRNRLSIEGAQESEASVRLESSDAFWYIRVPKWQYTLFRG